MLQPWAIVNQAHASRASSNEYDIVIANGVLGLPSTYAYLYIYIYVHWSAEYAELLLQKRKKNFGLFV